MLHYGITHHGARLLRTCASRAPLLLAPLGLIARCAGGAPAKLAFQSRSATDRAPVSPVWVAPRRSRGFTLLELMAALTVMLILGFIGLCR